MASMSSSVESGTADEDQIREFYILQIQKWINTSLEEIESIDQELVILRSRDAGKQVRELSWDGRRGDESQRNSVAELEFYSVTSQLELSSITARADGVSFSLNSEFWGGLCCHTLLIVPAFGTLELGLSELN